jgi:hypothetical protein
MSSSLLGEAPGMLAQHLEQISYESDGRGLCWCVECDVPLLGSTCSRCGQQGRRFISRCAYNA